VYSNGLCRKLVGLKLFGSPPSHNHSIIKRCTHKPFFKRRGASFVCHHAPVSCVYRVNSRYCRGLLTPLRQVPSPRRFASCADRHSIRLGRCRVRVDRILSMVTSTARTKVTPPR